MAVSRARARLTRAASSIVVVACVLVSAASASSAARLGGGGGGGGTQCGSERVVGVTLTHIMASHVSCRFARRFLPRVGGAVPGWTETYLSSGSTTLVTWQDGRETIRYRYG